MDITNPNLDSGTVEQVEEWFRGLLEAGVNFHPDDRFGDIVERKTGERSFTDQEALRMNMAMSRAHTICKAAGTDVYAVGVNVFEQYEAATPCSGCGRLLWHGLDVQRRAQEGENFYCDTCEEEHAS